MDINKAGWSNWLIVFSAGMYFFYEYIQMTIFNTMPRQLLEAFHISAYDLGKLSACYFLAQVIFLFPAGLLLDRFPPKRIILSALCLSVLSTLLFSYAHSYGFAVFSRFLSGVSGAFAFLSCMKLASQWLPTNRLSLATGLLVTLAVFGGFIAQAPFAWLVDNTSWRISLRILAGIGILISVNIFFVVKNIDQQSNHNKNAKKMIKEITASLKNSQTILSGAYICLMNLPVFLIGSLWGGLYLEEVHGLSHILATFIASMLFVGIIIGSPLYGIISDRLFVKRKPPMFIGALLSLVVILLLIFTHSNDVYYLSSLFFLVGLVSSAQCIGYPVIVENNKIELAATATGIGSIIIMGGGALIKITYSWILDFFWNGKSLHAIPIYSNQTFNLAMLTLPAAFLLAMGITFLLHETYCKMVKR